MTELKDMKPVGKFLYYTGTIRLYRNGDGMGFIWRWWNPLSWILAPILIILSVFIIGSRDTFASIEDIGLRVDPYVKKHGVEWL